MGKFKPRLKGKGKKWAKGQSSSSNPGCTKFREAAKSRFFTPNLGTSRALTIGALKTHDAFSSSTKVQPEEVSEVGDSVWSDATSNASSASFKTFASDWSHCSNMSFSKLLINFQPSSALHKEMLAVLAAVTEVIKANGGTESSTEYFGALMTALESSENEDSTAAILSLLSMGIKTVPQEVLRLKFSEVSKSLLDVFTKYSDSDNFIIIRNVIGCLSVVLRAQDTSVWANSSTHQVYQSVLVYTVFTKPKVRKAAQHAVLSILKGSSLIDSNSTHPAAAETAKFCIQQIEGGATVGGGSTALHILVLLKEVISTFPKTSIKGCCEAVLKLLTLGNAVMTSCCFQTLHGLFTSNPPTSRLPPTLNAQLINALYDYQPSITDWQSVLAWLTVMQEAYCHLARIDAGLCAENLLKLFTTITQFWLCDNSKILANATHSLRAITLDCFPLCLSHPNFPTISQNIFSMVEEGLKYQFHNAWPHVLNILAALFEALGPTAETFAGRCLTSLAELRDSYNFTHSAELEYTVGKAVRTLGPEIVLRAIPLQITGREINYEFKRTWLLPVLKENIQTAPLRLFLSYFLPLANICRQRSEELSKTKEIVGSHTYELLSSQLWALLPCFCNNPPDVAEHFRGLAPNLGAILNEKKSLRLIVMTALRRIITKSQENNNDKSIEMLSRFAKNFLPILFNIYTTKAVGTDEEGHRSAAFDTIKVYISIANSELCGELFSKAFTHLENADTDEFMKASVFDLVKAMLPKLDEARVEKVYSLVNQIFRKSQKSRSEEKKAYRLLEYLCACDSPVCREFMGTKITEVRKRLLKSVEKQNTNNAGARLRCLRLLVRLLPKNSFNVITALVPEAILRCKDTNARTRACAYDLLIEMFEISKEWSEKPDSDLVRDYLQMLVGGLAGSPTLVSATLLGLARLTYLLREQMPPDMVQFLLESVAVLLAEPTREIASACLGFIKTFLTAFPTTTITPHVPLIMRSIISMTEDCKRHSRIKIRDILARMLRKCGYETIKALIPDEDAIMLKRIKNLRKIGERKKKLRNAGVEDEESDDDLQFSIKNKPKSIEEILGSSDESEEEAEEKPTKGKKQQKKNQMYIREEEDDIVDLVSPAAASKLSVKKPARPRETQIKKKEASFEMTSTGKIVIPQNLASGSNATKNKKEADSQEAESDSEVDDVASTLGSVQIGRKRKLSVGTASVRSEQTAKYQAGGSGIHRPVHLEKKRGKSEDGDVKTGKEYRAKKARGDVKLKGKPDPYAYIPLSRKLLNKRKKAKASGRFKNIISSAVKGAKAGAKSKLRRTK